MPISCVQVWLDSPLINHEGHHGHKGKPNGLSFVFFVAIQRRDRELKPD
jgi:hypothetical protein